MAAAARASTAILSKRAQLGMSNRETGVDVLNPDPAQKNDEDGQGCKDELNQWILRCLRNP
jgi:hypothetical protein